MSKRRSQNISKRGHGALRDGQHSGQRLIVQQQRTELYSGPLPHPDILAKYDGVSPGTADKIIAMAESEVTHRHRQENLQLDSDIRAIETIHAIEALRIEGVLMSEKTGQWLGAALSLVALAGAVYTATQGVHYSIPIALVSFPVLGMVKALVNGRDKKSTPEKTST